MSNVINNEQLQKLLKKLDDLNPKKFEKALKIIGQDQLTSVLDTFAAEGRPQKWKDLAPMTKHMRAKKGKYPGKILQVTGSYLRSWNYRLIQDGVSIGTADTRAKLLNDGGTNDRGFKVPERKQDVVMPQDVTKHMATLNAAIQEVISK